MNYPIVISPLSEEDGGGFFAFAPDLMGCMSDGETQAEALSNLQDAMKEWIDLANRRNLALPEPGSAAVMAQQEYDDVIRSLKETTSHVHGVESRLDEIESKILELSEKIEHETAWRRFAKIADPSSRATSTETFARC